MGEVWQKYEGVRKHTIFVQDVDIGKSLAFGRSYFETQKL